MGVVILILENLVDILFYLIAAAGVLFALNFKKEENFLAKLPPIFKIVLFVILTNMAFGALSTMTNSVLDIGWVFDDYMDYEMNVYGIISCLKGGVFFLALAVGGFFAFRGLEFKGKEEEEE